VNDHAEQWLAAKCSRLKPSVANQYESVLGQHVLPHIGDFT
jgi:hypothetical protein